jgi:hypothetical protein
MKKQLDGIRRDADQASNQRAVKADILQIAPDIRLDGASAP